VERAEEGAEQVAELAKWVVRRIISQGCGPHAIDVIANVRICFLILFSFHSKVIG